MNRMSPAFRIGLKLMMGLFSAGLCIVMAFEHRAALAGASGIYAGAMLMAAYFQIGEEMSDE